jgi:cell division ATPase FtsA
VTLDVARGLGTRITDAERIKTFYGTVLAGGNDERDMITVPAVSDDSSEPPQVVSRATLVQIIRPRIEEILEMVRDRLAASPFAAEPRGTVVLTGGASHPRTAGPDRASIGNLRFTGGGKRSGLRGRCGTARLPAGGPSRTFRTAANAANDDRNGRLHLTGRQMAEGELLMTRTRHPRDGRWRTGRYGHLARVFMRQP